MSIINILTGPNIPLFGIEFPSGQVPSGSLGGNLDASLISLRATFGFNSQEHTFECDWAPIGSGYAHGASGNLPPINTELSFWVSGFYVKGLISHVDWDTSINGTIINTVIKDKRGILDQYKITTDDMGDNVPSGITSVAREYRLINSITTSVTRNWPVSNVTRTETEAYESAFKEYRRIELDGATYDQILTAIQSTFGSGVASKIPTTAQIQSNIGGDITSLRWKFSAATLRDVLDRITSDTAFDWYWNMENECVYLINKKTPFTIPEAEILNLINAYGGSGIDNVISMSYGKDRVDEPTHITLLGAEQEGMINSDILSDIDGIDTEYDGRSNKLVFEAAWPLLTVGFYDRDGFYRTYVPSEKELQMAIVGIEQWTYFKKYQSSPSPSGWSIAPDAGSIAAQHPEFESRLDPRQPIANILANPTNNLRVISNRRDLTSNWVIEFFNRINQHAQRHYGKSYINTWALTRNSGVFTLIDRAWCGVENYRNDASGLFIDDYEIHRHFGRISPFFGADYKISAYTKLPSGTVYGPQGEDTPASFASWTEDSPPFNPSGDGSHYIPCTLQIVGNRIQDPRRDDEFSFEDFPENTIWCQLPALCSSGVKSDDILANLSTLTEYALSLEQSGIIDLIDPRVLVQPYNALSGVAVPVKSSQRYGQIYPNVWQSGIIHPIYGTRIEIDENLAPWIEYPEGTDTSLVKLRRRATDRLNALMSIQNESQFLQIEQVGLPKLSFDSFANQTPNISGLIGEREHGVSEVSINYSRGGQTTSYKINSYYDIPQKPSPLNERTRARLNGVINPIDFKDLGEFLAGLRDGDTTTIESPTQTNASRPIINFDFERQEACEVIAIHNIFDEAACTSLMNGEDVAEEESYYATTIRNITFQTTFTQQTLTAGLNNFYHGLNTLEVGVIVISPSGNQPFLHLEVDHNTVMIDNNTGQTLTDCTIIVTNGEGRIRPSNETIRNSSEVDDFGAKCNDGYLNLGDPCIYLHKRVAGEELAYFTGGRKLNPGMVIEVEELNNATSTQQLYNVSIIGDAHGRWLCGLAALNNTTLSVGGQHTIVENGSGPAGGSRYKPGPESTGWTVLPASTGGGGIAAQITAITNIGTSGAYATVRELDSSGYLAPRTYTSVWILPYPEFAETGDRGIMASYSPTSGVGESTVKFIQISKQAFMVY